MYVHIIGSGNPYVYYLLDLTFSLNMSSAELCGVFTNQTVDCEVNNAQIQSLASSITVNCNDDVEKVYAIYNYVYFGSGNILDEDYNNTRYGAVGTINHGAGNCVDHTHVTIALSRALNIPALYNYVSMYDVFTDTWEGHCVAQVFVGGVWLVLDTSYYSNFGYPLWYSQGYEDSAWGYAYWGYENASAILLQGYDLSYF